MYLSEYTHNVPKNCEKGFSDQMRAVRMRCIFTFYFKTSLFPVKPYLHRTRATRATFLGVVKMNRLILRGSLKNNNLTIQ